jgi:hypothetical protein
MNPLHIPHDPILSFYKPREGITTSVSVRVKFTSKFMSHATPFLNNY